MAFDSLSDRLNKALRNVAGKGTLTDNNMEDMLKEVRLALLEADVNYRIVKEFLDEIRTKSRGEEVLQSVEPGQQLVKIVHDQIIELLGTEEAGLNFVEDGITKIMLVGLQGTGKTTSVAKIARICKEKFNKKVLLIAADVIRPAAIDQLQTLGKEIDTEVFTLGTETPAVETVRQGMEYAEKNGFDTVFIDTAGRLHIDEALMNEFLTNGGKAIPIVIFLDLQDKVLARWGSRPSVATQMVAEEKAKNGKLTPEFKEDLQRWYNQDKGATIVDDFKKILETI